MSVVIETTIGDVTIDLYLEKRRRTCLNFLKLCKMKYYNFCLFHKVQQNFIAQTGDPTGTGRGGESIFSMLYGDQAKYFDAELKPRLKHEKLGTVSMVNNGSNRNGSQFFITLGENLTYLDDDHSVFGEVAEGLDVLVKINNAICDKEHRPYQDIRITHTVILYDPYDDPDNLGTPPPSPVPTKELLQSDYLGADEEIDDMKGKTIEEIEEEIKDKEAKARATILEMVGDIPDAEVKPPENVLFVCKLNPVTSSEDLEIIFSRFGPVKSCEVIKDKKTGESLQYAFIEFEEEKDCENAYFKMDNVLIDDRRIHVDFSQSVAKLKWQNDKGKFEDLLGPKQETLVIKNSSRKGENYDLIFDSDRAVVQDDVGVSMKTAHHKKRSHNKKQESPSPYSKHKSHKHRSKSKHHKHKRSRSKSPSHKRHKSSKSSDKKH